MVVHIISSVCGGWLFNKSGISKSKDRYIEGQIYGLRFERLFSR